MVLKHKKTVIIVTGGPGTGKSCAAHRICSAIEQIMPLSYDEFKEKEWDRFGFDNREQKERLNRFALEEFYLSLQKLFRDGKTVLIEYPFHQQHRAQLSYLIGTYQYRAVTILLSGDWRVIYDRGLCRDQAKDIHRHPGHLTNTYHREDCSTSTFPDAMLTWDAFRADMERKNYDIRLGTTIPVDVTDFTKVCFEDILMKIRAADEI